MKCVKKQCENDRSDGSIFCDTHKQTQTITADEFIKANRRNNSTESRLQQSCVNWFRYKYPTMANLLFSIPNGGKRDIKIAMTMKREGVRPGVSDLLLMKRTPTHSGLWIEMKSPGNKLRPNQLEFQQDALNEGFAVGKAETIEEFQVLIKHYLNTHKK